MEMEYDGAVRYVKEQLEPYLQGKGINVRSNFRCLNPSHADRKPSMSFCQDDHGIPHCHCHGCQAHYSTFDLIAIDNGIPLNDTERVMKAGFEYYGITIRGSRSAQREDFGSGKAYQNQPKTERYGQSTSHNTEYTTTDLEDAPTIDFSDIVERAHQELMKRPEAVAHYQERGLSLDTIQRYKLGYDPEGYNHFLKDHPENQSKRQKIGLYRYILPYPDQSGRFTYFQTEISDRSQVDDYNPKYLKPKGGTSGIKAPIFNERYIMDPSPVLFICEGIYDALSVEEAGGKAIAFSGTAHRRFLGLCKKHKPNTTFVISLDNDPAGQDAIERVKEGLTELNIPYIVRTSTNGKDFNDALRADRGSFIDFVHQTEAEADEERRAKEEEARQAYLQTATAYHLQGFIEAIEKSKTAVFHPTGFPSLDALLDGGLYAGLYIVGAVTSLGKTSFCLQVMDNIAARGNDVLIISLEMARNELIAKSVSRHTLMEDLKRYGTTAHAKTVRGIMTGTRYRDYSQRDREIIEAGITAYSQYADHIFIHEGIGDIGINEVRGMVERHIKIMGRKPVVLVDYLQILSPYNERSTDKQNTDKAVLELKRLSRDYSVPVVAVSSFNRDNYTEPVNLTSFKESGAVEYSSDVLLGLQYTGMDYMEGEKDGDRQKRVRKLLKQQQEIGRSGKAQSIHVKVLKNRNGSKGETQLDFVPMFNHFAEKGKTGVDKGEEEDEWEPLENTTDPEDEELEL